MQLKTVEERVEATMTMAVSNQMVYDTMKNMDQKALFTQDIRQATTEALTQDRADIRAVLKAKIKEKQDDFYSDREWPVSANIEKGYELACNDILTLIDTLLPGDVSN